MIQANEIYLIEKLRELGVEEKKIEKLIESFEGWSIYIRKKKREYKRICEIYKKIRKAGVSRTDAIREISKTFEKCIQRVREIVEECEKAEYV